MSEQTMMTLRTAAPSENEVTESELAVFRFLDSLGIEYGWLFHKAKGSSHYGNEIYDVLEVPLPKNLFLVNKKGKHYMLMMHAEKKLRIKGSRTYGRLYPHVVRITGKAG